MTTYSLVTCSSTDNTTQKFFTWTSKLHPSDESLDILDRYHSGLLQRNCTLEGARITSCSHPDFPKTWEDLLNDRDLSYKGKFNRLRSLFPDLKVEVKFQTEKFLKRQLEHRILEGQRMSEVRALRESQHVG